MYNDNESDHLIRNPNNGVTAGDHDYEGCYNVNENKKDKYNIVYLIVVFTGIGSLIPWNFFITANEYFKYQLSTNSSTNMTTEDKSLSNLYENCVAVCSMVPLAIINILNLSLRRYITPMKRFNVGIIFMFLVFLITLFFTRINVSSFRITFFVITMISVAVLNIASGLIQGSALGIISMMPDKYIKCFMEGQAISGLLAAAANIFTTAVLSNYIKWSAFAYFFLALVFLLITGVGFSRLGKIKFSKTYIENASIMDNEQLITASIDTVHTINNMTTSLISTTSQRVSFKEKYLPIFKAIKWNCISVWLCFAVTLSVFPAIIARIQPLSENVSNAWKTTYFTPVTCFLFFNISDYFGRFLCGYIKIPSDNHPKLLFLCSVLRIVIIPLYFICNVSNKQYVPTYIHNDIVPILLTCLLGTSNGYLITLTLIYAPNQVCDEEKEAVGTIMSLFLCLGLTTGVGFSFLFAVII